MTWTKQTKANDSSGSGTGFLVDPGFLAQGFLSSPDGDSIWTKRAKASDLWTKQLSVSDSWTKQAKAI